MQRPDSSLDQQFQQAAAQLTLLALSQPRAAKLRVQAWLAKLREPTSNVVWKRNRNLYCALLLAQLQQGQLEPPFTVMPPDGSLPNLPNHLLYRALSPCHTATQPRSSSPVGGAAQQPHANLDPDQLQGLVQTFHSNMQARGFDLTRSRAGSAGQREVVGRPVSEEPAARDGLVRKGLQGSPAMQPGCGCSGARISLPTDAPGDTAPASTQSSGQSGCNRPYAGTEEDAAKLAVHPGDKFTQAHRDQNCAVYDARAEWAAPGAGGNASYADKDAAAREVEIVARMAAGQWQQQEGEEQRQAKEEDEQRRRQQQQAEQQRQAREEDEWRRRQQQQAEQQRQAREEDEWRRRQQQQAEQQRQAREEEWRRRQQQQAEQQRQAREEDEQRRRQQQAEQQRLAREEETRLRRQQQQQQRRASAKAQLDDVISRYNDARRQWVSPQRVDSANTRLGGQAGGAARTPLLRATKLEHTTQHVWHIHFRAAGVIAPRIRVQTSFGAAAAPPSPDVAIRHSPKPPGAQNAAATSRSPPTAAAPPELWRQGSGSTAIVTVTRLLDKDGTSGRLSLGSHGGAHGSSPEAGSERVHSWDATALRRSATPENLGHDQARTLQLESRHAGSRISSSLDYRGKGTVGTELKAGWADGWGGSGIAGVSHAATTHDRLPSPGARSGTSWKTQPLYNMFASPRDQVLPHYHSTVSYSPPSGSPPSVRVRRRSQSSSPTASPSGRKIRSFPDPAITYSVTRKMRSSPQALEALVKEALAPAANVAITPSSGTGVGVGATVLVPQPLAYDSGTTRRHSARTKFEFSGLITSLLPPPPVARAAEAVPQLQHLAERDSPRFWQASSGSLPDGARHADAEGYVSRHGTGGGGGPVNTVTSNVTFPRGHGDFESPGSSFRSVSPRAAARTVQTHSAQPATFGMVYEGSNFVGSAVTGQSSLQSFALLLASPPASPRRLAAKAAAAIAARPSPQRYAPPGARAPSADPGLGGPRRGKSQDARSTERIRRGGTSSASAARSRPVSAPSSRLASMTSARPASVPASSRFVPARRSAAPVRPRLSGSGPAVTPAAPPEVQPADVAAATTATERARSFHTSRAPSTQLSSLRGFTTTSSIVASMPSSTQLTEMARQNLAANLPPKLSFGSNNGSSRGAALQRSGSSLGAGVRSNAGCADVSESARADGAGSGDFVGSLGLLDLNESSVALSRSGAACRDSRSSQTSKSAGSAETSLPTIMGKNAAIGQPSLRSGRYGLRGEANMLASSSNIDQKEGFGRGTATSAQAKSSDGLTGLSGGFAKTTDAYEHAPSIGQGGALGHETDASRQAGSNHGLAELGESFGRGVDASEQTRNNYGFTGLGEGFGSSADTNGQARNNERSSRPSVGFGDSMGASESSGGFIWAGGAIVRGRETSGQKSSGGRSRVSGGLTGSGEPSQLARSTDSLTALADDVELNMRRMLSETMPAAPVYDVQSSRSIEIVGGGWMVGSNIDERRASSGRGVMGFIRPYGDSDKRSEHAAGADSGSNAESRRVASADPLPGFSGLPQRETPVLFPQDVSVAPLAAQKPDIVVETRTAAADRNAGPHDGAFRAAPLPFSLSSQLPCNRPSETQAQPSGAIVSPVASTAGWIGPGGLTLAMRNTFVLSAAEAAGELALLDVEGVIQEFERSLQDHLEFDLRPVSRRGDRPQEHTAAGSGGGTHYGPQSVLYSNSSNGGGGSSGGDAPFHSAASRLADRFALHSALADFRQAFDRLRRRLALHVSDPAVADALYGTSSGGTATSSSGAAHRYSSNPAQLRVNDRYDQLASSTAQHVPWRPGGSTRPASVDSSLRVAAARRAFGTSGNSTEAGLGIIPGGRRASSAERFSRVAAEAVAHYRDDVALLLSRVRAVLRPSVDGAVRGLFRSSNGVGGDTSLQEARDAALRRRLQDLAEDDAAAAMRELGLRRRLVSDVLHALEESAHQLGLQLVTLAAAPINMPPLALSRLRSALHDHLDAAFVAGNTIPGAGGRRDGGATGLSMHAMQSIGTGFGTGVEGRTDGDHRVLGRGGPFATPAAQALRDVVEGMYPSGISDDGGGNGGRYSVPRGHRDSEEADDGGFLAADELATETGGASDKTSEDLASTVGATVASDSLDSETLRARMAMWRREEPQGWLGDTLTLGGDPSKLEPVGEKCFLHQGRAGARMDTCTRSAADDRWRVGCLHQDGVGSPLGLIATPLSTTDAGAGTGGGARETASENISSSVPAIAAPAPASIGILAKAFASPPVDILPTGSAGGNGSTISASPLTSYPRPQLDQEYQRVQAARDDSGCYAIPVMLSAELPSPSSRVSTSPLPSSSIVTSSATVPSTTTTIDTTDAVSQGASTFQVPEWAPLAREPELKQVPAPETPWQSGAGALRLSRELEAALSAVREAAAATARQAAVAAAERQAAQAAARQAAAEAQAAALEAAQVAARQAAAQAAREVALAALAEWQSARACTSEAVLSVTRGEVGIQTVHAQMVEASSGDEEAGLVRRLLEDGGAQTIRLQAQIGELGQRLLEAEEEVIKSDKVADALRKQLAEAQEAAESLKDQLMNAEEAAQKRNWQVEELCRQLAEAQESEAARSQEAEVLRRQLAAVEVAEAASTLQAEDLRNQLTAAKEAAEVVRAEQINDLHNHLDAVKEEVDDARNQLASQRDALDATLREADVLRKQLLEAERAAEDRGREAGELRRQLSFARQAAEKETILIEDLQKRLAEAQAAAEASNAEAASLQGRLEDSQQRVEKADREVGELRQQVAAAKGALEAQVREVEALRSEKIKLQAVVDLNDQRPGELNQRLQAAKQAVEERGRDLLELQQRLVEKQAEAEATSRQVEDLSRQLAVAKEARQVASAAREAATATMLEAAIERQPAQAKRSDIALAMANPAPSLMEIRELAAAAAREAAAAVLREAATAQARDAAVAAAREEAAAAAVQAAQEAAVAAGQGAAAAAAERETAAALVAFAAEAASRLAYTRAALMEASQVAIPFLQTDDPRAPTEHVTVTATSQRHANHVKYDLTSAAPHAYTLPELGMAADGAGPVLPHPTCAIAGHPDASYTLAPQLQSPQSYRAVVREVSPRDTDHVAHQPQSPSPPAVYQPAKARLKSPDGSPPKRGIMVQAHAPSMLLDETCVPAVAAAVAAAAVMHHDASLSAGPALPLLTSTMSPRMPDDDGVDPAQSYDHDGPRKRIRSPRLTRSGGSPMPPLPASSPPPPPPPPRDWARNSLQILPYASNDTRSDGGLRFVHHAKAAVEAAHKVTAVHDVYSSADLALQNFRIRRQQLAASPPARLKRISSITTLSNYDSSLREGSDGSGAHLRDSHEHLPNTVSDSRASGSGSGFSGNGLGGNGVDLDGCGGTGTSGSGNGGSGNGSSTTISHGPGRRHERGSNSGSRNSGAIASSSGNGHGRGNRSSNGDGNGTGSSSGVSSLTHALSLDLDSRRDIQEFQLAKRQLGLVDAAPPLAPTTSLVAPRTLRTVPASPYVHTSQYQQKQSQSGSRSRSASYGSGSSLNGPSALPAGGVPGVRDGVQDRPPQDQLLDPQELAQRLRRLTDRTTQLQQRVAKLTKPLELL